MISGGLGLLFALLLVALNAPFVMAEFSFTSLRATRVDSMVLFGVPAASEVEESHSEEELHALVGQSGRQGVLEREEAERARAMLDLDERVAREVMIPKTEVAALPAGTRLGELVGAAAEGNHVRYPVHEDGDAARIVGAVHVKDVVRAAKENGGLDGAATARDIMRGVLTVPEGRRADGVLEDLREGDSRWPRSWTSGGPSRGSSP